MYRLPRPHLPQWADTNSHEGYHPLPFHVFKNCLLRSICVFQRYYVAILPRDTSLSLHEFDRPPFMTHCMVVVITTAHSRVSGSLTVHCVKNYVCVCGWGRSTPPFSLNDLDSWYHEGNGQSFFLPIKFLQHPAIYTFIHIYNIPTLCIRYSSKLFSRFPCCFSE